MPNTQQKQFLEYFLELYRTPVITGITNLAKAHNLNPAINSILFKGGLLKNITKREYQWNPDRPQPNLHMVNEAIIRYEDYFKASKRNNSIIESKSLPEQIADLVQERSVLKSENHRQEGLIRELVADLDKEKEKVIKLLKENEALITKLNTPWWKKITQ